MAEEKKADGKAEVKDKPVCGIVMPISAIDGCTAEHWVDVRAVLEEAIEAAGFQANMVSEAEDVGVIQKRIIQHLYDDPIVVCDVSGKNANVMFELGMRLAFDKPTIIVKDDKTSYSFDTSPVEHLGYPRDLRYNTIVEFKRNLAGKIAGTHAAASKDGSQYTTFLKHFGEFKVAKLEKKEVSGQEFIMEELKSMRAMLTRMQAQPSRGPLIPQMTFEGVDEETFDKLCHHHAVTGGKRSGTGEGVLYLRAGLGPKDVAELEQLVGESRTPSATDWSF